MPGITIATANTYLGKMLKDPEGLAPFADTDILLMQEVDPVANQLQELVEGSGFQIAAMQVGIGLAILNRNTVELKSTDMTLLQTTPAYQRAILQRFREHPLQTLGRGVLHAEFETEGGNLTVLTGHANVPVKPLARATYLRKLPTVVQAIEGSVVLGMDGNHWPGPRQADIRMAERAGLERVDIGDEYTYSSARSRHAWIGTVTRNLIKVDAQLDSMYFTPDYLTVVNTRVRDIPADHRAIVTTFVPI